METIGKSTLLGFKYRLVGFSHVDHPVDSSKKVQTTYFKQESVDPLYLICVSEVSRKQMKTFKAALRKSLGATVSDEEVIPYVQRSIAGGTFEQFQGAMQRVFGQSEWVES